MKPVDILLDGDNLTLERFATFSRQETEVSLSDGALSACNASRKAIETLANSENAIYGVNTGFGIFSNTRIKNNQSSELSNNLIMSHSVGYGKPFDDDVTRGAMLIRANTLARGCSGINPQLIENLIQMINKGVIPVVPEHGSLGASGDLAPLAHISLVLADLSTGEAPPPSGLAKYQGALSTGQEAMEAAGIPRIRLGSKDGLALTNGAAFTASLLALACISAECALLTSEIALSATAEALLGVSTAFDERLHLARAHPGQVAVASRVREHLRGSSLINSTSRVQDAYSIRCAPQIIGPAWDILSYVKTVCTREMNASTDNPLIFGEQVLSGGNFHGSILGQAADFLKIALSEVASLSEKRTFRLTSSHTNEGLPSMLVADVTAEGIHSGLMMLQYTAASLVLEIQHLALPDSLHSIPTSAGQEDHNPNSTTAGRNLRKILDLLFAVLAIEFICAFQAIDIRMRENPVFQMGKTTSLAYDQIRELVPFVQSDRPLYEEIERCKNYLNDGGLCEFAEPAL